MALKDYTLKITSEEVETFAKACLKNATELLDDAKLLLKNKRNARAYYLTVIALEEIGKCKLLFNIHFSTRWNDKKWRNFWKSIYDHRAKQRVFYKRGMVKKMSRIDFYAMEGLKQFSLYAGHFPEATALLEPKKVFSRASRRVQRHIAFTESALHEEKLAWKNTTYVDLARNLTRTLNFALDNPEKDIESGKIMYNEISKLPLDPCYSGQNRKLSKNIQNGKISKSQLDRKLKKVISELIDAMSPDH